MSWNGTTEKVAVLTSSSAAEQAAEDISETSETCIVGFDTEWGSKGEVALVQLATDGRCLLFLLPEVHLQDCPSLLRLFQDPRYLKVGVAVGLDAELLKEQFQIELRGCVDLARLAAGKGGAANAADRACCFDTAAAGSGSSQRCIHSPFQLG